MWVRSQNGLKLVDCKSFEIKQGKIDDDEFAANNKYWNINKLAEYDSMEKCLMVIDAIERLVLAVPTNICAKAYKFPQNDEV